MAYMLQRRLLTSLMILGLILGTGLLTPSLSMAQSGEVSGKVKDATTGESLPGANVIIKGTTIGAATNIKGNYTIHGAPVGTQTLLVSYMGYKTEQKTVTVKKGKTITVNFSLQALSLKGQEVVVSVQASGQKQAINQQLSSNTIENVVSASRIRSLPDVNAAESVGRLPGVSIERSGGEATKVAIRGLAPKYNLVTINGIQVPATGGSNRSVNLSIISSNMLDGISLKKVVTPDMNADVLGGTVDLQLKEAPDTLNYGASFEGGYNKLKDFYGNYQGEAHFSDRFFHKKFGVMASFNSDRFDRSANIYSGSYYLSHATTGSGVGQEILNLQNVNLNENNVIRSRIGGSLVLDYRIPKGKFTLNALYNKLDNNSLNHNNMYDVQNSRHYVQLVYDPKSTSSIFTSALGFKKDLNWVQINASIAESSTLGRDPSNYSWQFDRESNIFKTGMLPTPKTQATDIPGSVKNDSTQLRFSNMYLNTTHRNEYVTSAKLNLKFPFQINDQIGGYIKTGGQFRWLRRMNNQTQIGRNGMQYGNTVLNNMSKVDSAMHYKQLYSQYGFLPMNVVSTNYYRPHFLNGQFGNQPLSFAPELAKMQRMWNDLVAAKDTLFYYIPSLGSDYHGNERYGAAYIMAKFNLGKHITFIPGVRYEHNYTRYTGARFMEVSVGNVERPPKGLTKLTNVRTNSYWFPDFQLKIQPVNWLNLRLARTQTLTRPDFTQYAPITTINSQLTYIRAANTQLQPATATNYDAALSIFQNQVGLFTVDGFYKNIKNLVFQTTTYLVGLQIPPPPNTNIPQSWYAQSSPQVDTYQNNKFNTTYKGVSLSWQTNFWYLPSILKGLVLDVNFSRIFSRTRKQLYRKYVKGYAVPPGGYIPKPVWGVKDTSRVARMPDQPKYIANVTLGFDYKGFSARLSYLYQTDQITYISGVSPILDNYTGGYHRFDLAIKQNLPDGFQLYANLNNLNNERDHNYQDNMNHPTYIQDYGFTGQIGIRYSL